MASRTGAAGGGAHRNPPPASSKARRNFRQSLGFWNEASERGSPQKARRAALRPHNIGRQGRGKRLVLASSRNLNSWQLVGDRSVTGFAGIGILEFLVLQNSSPEATPPVLGLVSRENRQRTRIALGNRSRLRTRQAEGWPRVRRCDKEPRDRFHGILRSVHSTSKGASSTRCGLREGARRWPGLGPQAP